MTKRIAVSEQEKTLVERAREVEALRRRLADLRQTWDVRRAKLDAEFDGKIDQAQLELETAQAALAKAAGVGEAKE